MVFDWIDYCVFEMVYDEQGRHTDAADLFARVLQGRRSALGPEHPLTLQAMTIALLIMGRQR